MKMHGDDKIVISRVLKIGFYVNIEVMFHLITMYVKRGCVEKLDEVLDKMHATT